jgi:hypothetical protein
MGSQCLAQETYRNLIDLQKIHCLLILCTTNDSMSQISMPQTITLGIEQTENLPGMFYVFIINATYLT